MFTGIVQAVAKVEAIKDDNGIRTFALEFPEGFTEDLAIGASVAVDGVCLTATTIETAKRVLFDVMLQSLAVTTLGDCEVGTLVNVERAAKDGAEIGGHPLSGHIDFAARVDLIKEYGANKSIRFSIPRPFERYIFAKGYIAINGCSLTVSECNKAESWFEIWLIPETRRVTNLDFKREGEMLNVEIDRSTQVVVDTVRDAVAESLGELRPLLETVLKERGLVLEDLVKPSGLLPPRQH
ncbi:riboflavin synthase subunit alpha (plasmid) [Bosea sp. F3-2]|uniref:riboflavin synthase subunit alpha n=1 Tax=Bosea sp. F3-2 TaxID=2599640 RepID=UPI0011EE5D25|nr:riboflavin synthase subunit alpha [Bosea sp. F3-2]QEL26900.1 riboflavin synthase subunit alpha [Bosea sp. F3-2]